MKTNNGSGWVDHGPAVRRLKDKGNVNGKATPQNGDMVKKSIPEGKNELDISLYYGKRKPKEEAHG